MSEKYLWGHNNPFNDYSNFLRNKFNNRVQKLSLNVGFTCPNRDGSRGTGGCTFCNNNTFNPDYCEPGMSITNQLNTGISFFRDRYPEQLYLAYFQAYTNTYGPLDQLEQMYEEALKHPGIVGLVVGTRPDCLPDELIEYFMKLQKDYYVVVELGIESTNEETLKIVNRGHTFEETREAILKLNEAGLPIGGHLIMGLPGESNEVMLSHADVLSGLPLNYLKLHQLQYVKGSALGKKFQSNPDGYRVLDPDEYIEIVIDFLERLNPSIVVERLASQAPYNLLLAPRWGLKNFQVVEIVRKRMLARNTWQGRLFNAY
ncbi:TIGR01212 family radical SAM protein [Marinilabilia salmonicolor]|uniref:TIGR01212 family radical SAM protein n=1 Tax=Marinilabilia salmonicolor TaxID=989 RepID=UPI00029A920C|nr:TIGR01212 family radical SAM protein [Marinilabilia salmonicolor]